MRAIFSDKDVDRWAFLIWHSPEKENTSLVLFKLPNIVFLTPSSSIDFFGGWRGGGGMWCGLKKIQSNFSSFYFYLFYLLGPRQPNNLLRFLCVLWKDKNVKESLLKNVSDEDCWSSKIIFRFSFNLSFLEPHHPLGFFFSLEGRKVKEISDEDWWSSFARFSTSSYVHLYRCLRTDTIQMLSNFYQNTAFVQLLENT